MFQLPHVLSVHFLAMLTVIRDHSQEVLALQWQVIPSRKLVARCSKHTYAKASAGPCFSRFSYTKRSFKRVPSGTCMARSLNRCGEKYETASRARPAILG